MQRLLISTNNDRYWYEIKIKKLVLDEIMNKYKNIFTENIVDNYENVINEFEIFKLVLILYYIQFIL